MTQAIHTLRVKAFLEELSEAAVWRTSPLPAAKDHRQFLGPHFAITFEPQG